MPLILLNNLFVRLLFIVNLTLITMTSALSDEVRLESIDGNHHSISEYIGKGKWTVLNIWGAKCPPCREEMPDLVQFYDSHKDLDATVVGIAIDFPSYGYANKQEVIEFSEDFMIDFPLLLSDESITQQLGLGPLQGLPTTYLYSPKGDVAGVQVGAITKKILEDFINKQQKK